MLLNPSIFKKLIQTQKNEKTNGGPMPFMV